MKADQIKTIASWAGKDRLVPIPDSDKRVACDHDYRMLNRQERRNTIAKKFGAEAVCVKCGCMFVDKSSLHRIFPKYFDKNGNEIKNEEKELVFG